MKKNNITLYSLVGIIFILFSCKSIAQVSDGTKLSEKDKIEHKKNFSSKLKDLGMAIKPDYFYAKKINLTKINEFKKIGLDLVSMGNKVGTYNYKENVLISNLVIQGTIVEKKYHPKKELQFHTTYKIKIETVLKGNYSEPYVYVKMISGATGEDKFMRVSDEPQLFLGEKVLLMLNAVDVDEFSKAKKNGYFNKTLNATKTDYTISGKYSLKLDTYFNSHKERIGTKTEVQSLIKKIVAINQENNFYKLKF